MVSSVTTTDFSSELGFNKFPYLSVKIPEARNLKYFSERSEQFTPYIKISVGSRSYSTAPQAAADTVQWNESFELSGDGTKPLVCCLMDKDEFDGDIMLAGISIPRELVKQFKEETTLWIRLRSFASSPNMTASFEDSNSIKPFSEDMQIQNPDETVEPIICIKVTYYGTECLKEYKVEISEFESAVKNSELFTQYTLTITRRDGYDWKIKFRYSQLDNIRKSLILQFPELKKLCFPKKTYFNFINLLKNQFNDEMIRKRKDEMEKFLNYVIKCRYHERNQEFNDFLHMHQGNE